MGTGEQRFDRVPPPWVGVVGFRGDRAVTPPVTWEWQHRLAEAGGYYREGRRWRKANTDLSVVPIACAPSVRDILPE